MTLSLCMIVKNEEDNLKRCLNSVKDIVDEIIIVDTGSVDGTVEIAKSFGARIYNYAWTGDFSKARNYSLQFATCDWILLMDADDELVSSEQSAVLKLLDNNNAEAYFFRTISFIDSVDGYEEMQNLNMRLIRNGKGYYFSNPIHEQIYMNIKKITPDAVILNKDIRINHYGYLNKNIINKDKRNRNIEILKKEIEDNPGYSFALFNLGNEYFAQNDYYNAIENYEMSYCKFDPDQGFSSKLILKMANCFMHLGKNDDALNIIDKGIKLYPLFTDLFFLKALIFYYENKITLAIEYLKICIKMGDAPIELNTIVGCGTYRSHFILAELQYEFEDYEKALENYVLAYKFNTKNFILAKIVKCLCSHKASVKLISETLEELRVNDSEAFDITLANNLIEEKYYDLALIYAKKAEIMSGKSEKTVFLKSLCKIYLKKYKESLALLDDIKDKEGYTSLMACYQTTCCIMERNYSKAEKSLTNARFDPKDKHINTYKALVKILTTGEKTILSEDEKESEIFSDIIFEILKILLRINEFELFEKALTLLNCISDNKVLLRLAKLYYNEGHYKLALQELMRTVKIFDLIDSEGAKMLYKLKKMSIFE